MRQSENEMTEQIFLATERLMAEGGLHNLSMHKIAKKPIFLREQFIFTSKVKRNC